MKNQETANLNMPIDRQPMEPN